MKKFYSLVPALLILLSQATVGTDGTFTVTNDEVSGIGDALINAVSSLLTLVMQFGPYLVIAAVVLGGIAYLKHKK